MANKLLSILFLVCASAQVAFAQPANDNCASATTLVSGASPTCSQTTDAGTVQGGEVTATGSTGASAAFSQTVWYKFVATSTSMYVEWEFTGLVSGATWCPTRMAMVVYNSSTCIPGSGSILASESSASDGAIVIYLTGLTVGNTYLVQVGYNDGSGCKAPVFCMAVGNTPANCTCASPCTSGCGYASTPSVATVTSTCPEYVLTPLSDGGETHTFCYSFVAASTTVSFSMIISSNCSGGNVTALTWTLQTSSCGATVASGTLASMSATTTVGTSYVLCYTYTIPTGCHHSSVYPYFVGASPLSIELLSYEVKKGTGKTFIDWSTTSETNNHYFTVEKSIDGTNFEILATVEGAGTSNRVNTYSVVDLYPAAGVNYYRLGQTNYDGFSTYSGIRTVYYDGATGIDLVIAPNPASDGVVQFDLSGSIDQTAVLQVFDISGKLVYSYQLSLGNDGKNSFILNSVFNRGVYLVQISSEGISKLQKLVIN
ncbi:MAG TPA: T9SS type A sorting domain-containing protein [Flavobacteriales bacterium]|nr:T9SS type A sorting domain-containing protein [Flavobacteriales bacterium]